MRTRFLSMSSDSLFLLVMCGLTLFFLAGCGNDDDDGADELSLDNSYYTPLNPVNGAAYDDMFFEEYGTNPFIDTEDERLSTFGMDVDTASYSISRSYIRDGYLPPKDAVRVEEFVNAFDYDYPPPAGSAFGVHIEASPSRFGEGNRLYMLRIGIKGRVVEDAERKDAILTFVIDVSGSMSMENRLGLVKRSLAMLVDQLRVGDEVGIVVYGSRARTVLPHTGLESRHEILAAIDRLQTEGATNAEEGLRMGYDLALHNFRSGSINRVVLCSDGVANVGQTGSDQILRQVRGHVQEGITLSTVGFGMGNYNDVLMEQLANDGNGNYAYVDTLNEARRVFVENATGTLQMIAKDAKVQVDFNPQVVSRFRLLGYENRLLDHDDFRDDQVDGGEVGAGHNVTALYEVKLNEDVQGDMATVHIRYEDPETSHIREFSETIFTSHIEPAFAQASAGFQLACAVAEFAEILRGSYWARNGSFDSVYSVLRELTAQIDTEEFIELLGLVRTAMTLEESLAEM